MKIRVINIKKTTYKVCQHKKYAKRWTSLLDDYTQKENSSNDVEPVLLKGIHWELGRPAETMKVNSLDFGVQQQGNFSKSRLVYPEVCARNKLSIFSFEELYRFAGKQNFEAL
uniref:hypothetical protein n=1 Tax=Pedobacter schmidteae TaxID=2201271 RepID=UPI000EAC408F|nr:hypothetical protein [Pedobacter schmidteae]